MSHKPLDILAFAPHPDDAELGCGGSLILAAQQGLRVAVADLSAGEMSSRGTPEQRKRETQKATELLGLCARFSLGLPDTRIGTELSHREPIIQLIREIQPRIVLAPYWQDRHPDHAAAGKLVREACFLAGAGKVGTGFPHRPEWVYYYMTHQPFEPSFVIDISTVWKRKMAAIMAYQSQLQADDNDPKTAISRPEYLRALEARAIWFGAMIGAAYGEAFYTPGPVPLRRFPGLSASPPSPGELPSYRVY
jgi:bacillithiol biosynthesis deacetylase BshB1